MILNAYDYTFVVISYNECETILMTLESIKYQIVKYAENKKYRIQLILADDASSDGTTNVMDLWIKENAELFTGIDRNYLKVNKGTCYNFVKAIELIRGKFFRTISGDDIIPEENIFKILDMLNEYDVIVGNALYFEDKNYHIINTPRIDRLMIKYYSLKYISDSTYFSCPILNGAVYKKELLTRNVLDNILKYKYLEDRPQWFHIFKENPNLKLLNLDYVSLLYRVSGTSVSGSHISMDDLEKFKIECFKDTGSLFIKFSIIIRGNRFFKLLRFFDKYWIEYAFKRIFYKNDMRNRIILLNEHTMPNNTAYLNRLKEYDLRLNR